jgi:ThiF family
MRNYSVVFTEDIHRKLYNHLIRVDKQEDLCFATYLTSTGQDRYSAILQSVIKPKPNERKVHGNACFLPSYFERAMSIARQRNEGLVFLHSHPWPGWQNMSEDDIVAENRMAPAVMGSTGLPLLGMTVGNDEAWSARFWIKDSKINRKYNRSWCENVRVIGDSLKVTFNDNLVKSFINPSKQLRTISAWGEQTQKDLTKLKIGIVGLGSVGSFVAESLARIGISDFTLIDFDIVEEKNLDRVLNVFSEDIGNPKVTAVKRGVLRSTSALSIKVNDVTFSICEKAGFQQALNCDVLFSCVDRPWARQVLNFIANAHLIPVIDGGVFVRTNKDNSKIKGADWKAQTVGYNRACLECLGQYKTEMATLERDRLMDSSSYINGLVDKSFLDVHENVYAFSSHLASMEVLQFLSLFISPSGISNIGQQIYHFVPGILDKKVETKCNENCFFQLNQGKGDFSGVQVWDRHLVAERVREKYK